eukprot:COSAG06_NODE_10194_length_1731_cov_1.167279_2_plen_71_part_00
MFDENDAANVGTEGEGGIAHPDNLLNGRGRAGQSQTICKAPAKEYQYPITRADPSPMELPVAAMLIARTA